MAIPSPTEGISTTLSSKNTSVTLEDTDKWEAPPGKNDVGINYI